MAYQYVAINGESNGACVSGGGVRATAAASYRSGMIAGSNRIIVTSAMCMTKRKWQYLQ